MNFIVVACLFTIAYAAPNVIVGREKCTWGPAYWCQNYKQAAECKAFEHCRTRVWKSNDLCGDCEEVVDQVNKMAKNNASHLTDLAKQFCDKLGDMSDVCKLAITQYGNELVKIIVEITSDSKKSCQELELCPTALHKVQLERMKKIFFKKLSSNKLINHLKSSNADYCEDCKLVFAEVKDVLENKDVQKDIIALAEKVCGELPSIATQCKSIVDTYLPMVLEYLDSLIDPAKVCGELGLCNSTTKNIVAAIKISKSKLFFPMAPGPVIINAKPINEEIKTKAVKSGPECVICEFVMKELDSILAENATKEEIEAALEKVCSLLPSTIEKECDNFVSEYANLIIQLLLEEMSPQEICTAIGLCTSTKTDHRKLVHVALEKNSVGDTEVCEVCKLAVQYLENILSTNATEEEIKQALDEFCSMLPSTIASECEALVNQYGDMIIKLILGEITPEEVCKAIGMCTSSALNYRDFLKNNCHLGDSYVCAKLSRAAKCKEMQENGRGLTFWCMLEKHITILDKEDVSSVKSVTDDLCEDCQFAIDYLGHSLSKNVTKDDILSGLKVFCSRFLPPAEKYCYGAMKQYGDLIADILLGKVNPKAFCEVEL